MNLLFIIFYFLSSEASIWEQCSFGPKKNVFINLVNAKKLRNKIFYKRQKVEYLSEEEFQLEELAYNEFFRLNGFENLEEIKIFFQDKINIFYEFAATGMNTKIDTGKLPFHKIYIELKDDDQKILLKIQFNLPIIIHQSSCH